MYSIRKNQDLMKAFDGVGVASSECIRVTHCRKRGRRLRTEHQRLTMILERIFVLTTETKTHFCLTKKTSEQYPKYLTKLFRAMCPFIILPFAE